MPIICFEGASAVGKTTLSSYLRDNYNAYVIPEVNLLFERKDNEPKFWYFEKQVKRWQLAVGALKNFQTIILDGDAFQPLWYNWAYGFDFGEPFEAIADFYRRKLEIGEIDFPDTYFILSINNDELEKRKVGDDSRTRKNFERHLQFIKPQRAYFNFMKSINNDLVEFIENKEIKKTSEKIINSIAGKTVHSNKKSSLILFDEVENWLRKNNAENFKL